MKHILRKHTIVAVVAALAVVAAGVGVAYAAGSLTPQQQRDAYFADVAKRAGVSADVLRDAMKGASTAQVDAALAAGTITKAQADAAKARIASGQIGPFAGQRGHGGMMGRGGLGAGACLDGAADFLGLTQAELRTELAAGKSLADVAKAKGKSVDALTQALVKAETARLDAAVKAGTITADQKAQILTGLEQRIEDMVNRTRPAGGKAFGGGGMRGHGGMGGFGMSGGGAPTGAGFNLS